MHTLVLTEKLVLPEHLAYKVLGTALEFLTKMTEGTAATLQKEGRVSAVAAILVLAIAWESSGEHRFILEDKVKLRCTVKNNASNRAAFAMAKGAIIEAVGNFEPDYMQV